MNERIKQLAEKAGAEFWQRLENDVVKENAYVTFDPPESLEKFAELLLKDCGRYLNSPEFIGRSDLDWAMVLNEHFGVEE